MGTQILLEVNNKQFTLQQALEENLIQIINGNITLNKDIKVIPANNLVLNKTICSTLTMVFSLK